MNLSRSYIEVPGGAEDMFDYVDRNVNSDASISNISSETPSSCFPHQSHETEIASSDILTDRDKSTSLSNAFKGAALMRRDMSKYKLRLGKTDYSDAQCDELLSHFYTAIQTLIREDFDGPTSLKTSVKPCVSGSTDGPVCATVTRLSRMNNDQGNKGFPESKRVEP